MSEARKVPPSECPNCKKVQNRVTNLDGPNAPIPGDVTLCFHCGNLNVFGDEMQLRPITPAEEATLPREQRIRIKLVQATIEKLNPKRTP